MKNRGKRKVIALVACVLALVFLVQLPVEAEETVSCSKLYGAVKEKCQDGAKKVYSKDKCTFLSYSYRKKAEDFYYATDSNQVYCVCIVKAESTSDAKDIKKQFDSIKKDKKNDRYLKKDEKKVVTGARTGRSGSYVWYICLGSSSGNKKAEKALKKAL